MNKSSLIQCYKCQGFGHSASNCYRKANCRCCSEKHESKNCPKREVPLSRCINCSGSPEANSAECPVYVKVLECKLKKAKTNSNVKPNSPLTCNDSHFPKLKTKGPTPFQLPIKSLSWPIALSTTPIVENPPSFSSCIQDIKELFKLCNILKIKSSIKI